MAVRAYATARRALRAFLAPTRLSTRAPRGVVLPGLAPSAVAEVGTSSDTTLAALQAETIRVLRGLVSGRHVPLCRINGPLDLAVVPLFTSGRYAFVPQGSLADAFWFQLVSLLASQSLEPMRLCRAPDCETLFFRVRRQEYCSPRCQRRSYMRAYRA